MRTAVFVCLVTTLAAAPAFAQEDWEKEREEERYHEEMEQLSRELPKVTPDPGRDKAPVRPPPWCSIAHEEGSWSPSSIARSVQAAQRNGWNGYFDPAKVTCLWPKEPAVQKAVAVIEQSWINITGLSEAEALETFELRLDADKLKADKKKLCSALTVDDEVQGEERAFMKTRRALFGCVPDGWAENDPLWAQGGTLPDDLLTYLDNSATEVDDIVRLAVVTEHSRFALDESNDYLEHQLLTYVLDQVDYKAFSRDKVLKMLDAAPYQGNTYARAVVLESIGRSQMALAALDGILKKKTADEDWKELLIAAPQRGIDGWNKDAQQWKDVIARSNEFEHKFWGPSRKALKGCWPKLRADFLTVAKTLPHANPAEFKEALSDPVASLLFMRLAACGAVDTDNDYASVLLAMTPDLRYSRGPRLAAYYAALDALSQIVADRTKFPIKPKDFVMWKNQDLYDEATRAAADKHNGMGFVGDSGEGVVKSVKKSGGGVEVTFVHESHKVMGQDCVDTNHVITIRPDGSLVYAQKCHDTGWITIDDTPGAITVPAEWADGIKAGATVAFDAAIGQPPGRMGLPKAVYGDKNKKKLVNFYGFGL